MKTYKIIFTGPAGVEKKAAIELICDSTAHVDNNMPMAMDFGIKCLANNDILHLYESLEKDRLSPIHDFTIDGGLGVIILIDNRRKTPFIDLDFYLKSFKKLIGCTGVAIGIIGMDDNPNPEIDDYYKELKHMGYGDAPVFEVDLAIKIIY